MAGGEWSPLVRTGSCKERTRPLRMPVRSQPRGHQTGPRGGEHVSTCDAPSVLASTGRRHPLCRHQQGQKRWTAGPVTNRPVPPPLWCRRWCSRRPEGARLHAACTLSWAVPRHAAATPPFGAHPEWEG
eukprot:scaffold168907_cov31-Tisochrysis_lutea.AAC.2